MKRRAEGAVRSLGLYATYAGYFSLLDLVVQLADGRKYGRKLWIKVAERHEVSVKRLDSQFRRLMICARRNSPERWREWFGSKTVSMELFLHTIAKHAGV